MNFVRWLDIAPIKQVLFHVVLQDIVDQQKQLIVKLRSAACKSLPNNANFTYSQPTHRSDRSSGNGNILHT